MTVQNDKLSENKFRFVFETIDVANTLTVPLLDSIEQLLRVSASEMNSKEASVIIREDGEGNLRFLSAIGEVADRLVNLKIPAGKGIAGFVFSSGQPMALTEVGDDESFYSEVDRQTGYSTQNILATPLRRGDEIIGVLEYVNRIGEPNYTPAEMDKAALFAEAIASLVFAYESAKLFESLSNEVFSGKTAFEFSEIRGWLDRLQETAERKEMIELALLVREIAGRSDAERQMCIEVLNAILRCSSQTATTSFLNL